jgi:hypothetical protein
MSLDNFAILSEDIDISVGESLVTYCQDGTLRADVGLTALSGLASGASAAINGTLRFQGAEVFIGAAPAASGGITQNDSLVGVINSLPALIQSYLALAPNSCNNLPLSPSATSMYIYPGVNVVAGDWNLTFSHLTFTGGLASTYIILVLGNAVLTNPLFDSLPNNLIVVVSGSLDIESNLATIDVPGRWMVDGPAQIGGSNVTRIWGQILQTAIGFTHGLAINSSVEIHTPPFANPSIIEPDALQCVALPVPSLC